MTTDSPLQINVVQCGDLFFLSAVVQESPVAAYAVGRGVQRLILLD